uniref:Uncharacterized protein n=1 Tax=Hucho hucho TaxID=62062 RepID=A0A4W5RGJ4_9TELE
TPSIRRLRPHFWIKHKLDFFRQPVGEGALERQQAAGFPSHDNPSSLKSVGASQDMAPAHPSTNIKCPPPTLPSHSPLRPDLYGMFGYYLVDAVSILPALDFQECAAPVLLQTQAIRKTIYSRYDTYTLFQHVLSICGNSFKTVGKAFQVKLVENNIFKRAVCPGVEVVYSTCSLSQLQNQGGRLLYLLPVPAAEPVRGGVASLRPLTRLFKDTFHLAPDLHLGQLVLPHLTTNFGPIYMCKLQRLN